MSHKQINQSVPKPPRVLGRIILHPFFLAGVPVLSLFSANQEHARLGVVVGPLLVSLSATGLIFLLLRIWRKSWEQAALLTSLVVLFFFMYGNFATWAGKLRFGEFVLVRNMHRVPVYTLLFLAGGYGMVLLRKRWRGLTQFLNFATMALTLLVLISVALHHAAGAGRHNVLLAEADSPERKGKGSTSLPDIYYIILDGYAGEESLEKFFGYDNSSFMGYLKRKGFYVPPKARSNYPATVLSLGSSLSLDYLHARSMSELPANQVKTLVETNGYRYIALSSMNPSGAIGRTGRGASNPWLQDEFTLQLLRTTVIDAFALRFRFYTHAVRESVLSTIDELESLPSTSGPKFVFCHILCPHPPYVFKANGDNPRSALSNANLSVYRSPWDDKQAYLDQIKFLNGRMPRVIDAILTNSPVPPVIVLQADHGPKFTVERAVAVQMHLHILNAYYLPGGATRALYDGITPVNTFRLVFNEYLQCHFPLLEDRSYFSLPDRPFEFQDVTHNRIE